MELITKKGAGVLDLLHAQGRPLVLKHLQNIYDTRELEEKATCAKIAQVRQEGQRKVIRQILHYNLDAIIRWDTG